MNPYALLLMIASLNRPLRPLIFFRKFPPEITYKFSDGIVVAEFKWEDDTVVGS